MDGKPRCFICGDGADYRVRISTDFGFQMAIPICKGHNYEDDVKALVNMTRVTGSPEALIKQFSASAMSGPYYQGLMGEINSGQKVTVFRITEEKNPGLLWSLFNWLFGGKK